MGPGADHVVVTRSNGAAPPEVPLADVCLGSWDFWGRDDDYRERALATLRRAARHEWPLADVDRGSWYMSGGGDYSRDGAFATLRREAPASFHSAYVVDA